MKRILLFAFATLLTTFTFSQTILYVDSAATGANNGSSWTNAYKYLSSALAAANTNGSIDTIFVAKGTYYPTGDKAATNRDSAFLILRSHLSIFGGFDPANGITSMAQRSFSKYGGSHTILSGNINNQSDSLDNSWHVMVIAAYESDKGTVELDGITIREGNGTMPPGGYKYYAGVGGPYSYYGAGGGMLVTAPNILLKIRNSKIVNNVTQGIHCRPDLEISNSSVVNNMAPAGSPGSTSHLGVDGGGLYCLESLNMNDCLVADNLIYYGFMSRGAGVFVATGSMQIKNSVIRNNSIIDVGGCSGLMINGGGGGIYSSGFPNLISNTMITGNKVSITEGCVWSGVFKSERYGGGGGIALFNHAEVVNTVVANNMVEGTNNPADAHLQFGGGGISVFGNFTVRLLNSTIYGNTAVNGGAIASLEKAGTPTILLHNSVVLNNSSVFALNTSPNIFYSLVQGSSSTANGNLDGTNPGQVFVNPATYDFHLFPTSVCINAGDNNFYSSSAYGHTDIFANNRIINSRIDMGPSEYGTAPVAVPTILYVDSSVAVSGNGSSWSSPFKYLSDAIGFANEYSTVDSILIAKGTYYPTGVQNGTDRNSSFLIRYGGLKLFGGFPSGGGSFAQRVLPAVTGGFSTGGTILSGDIQTAGDSTDNSYHLMVVTNIPAYADSIVIDGMSFHHGNANATGQNHTYNGQSVYQYAGAAAMIWNVANSGKLLFRSCNFNNNISDGWAGAIFNQGAQSSFEKVNFFNNISLASEGGAVFNTGASSSMKFSIARFEKNASKFGSGGALYNHNSASYEIERAFFFGNASYRRGGAIINDAGTRTTVTNSLFYQNRCNLIGTTEGGAAVHNNNAQFTGINCTFLKHSTSPGILGFLTGTNGGTVTLHNSVATHNTQSGGVAVGSGTTYTQTYSLVEGQNYSTDQNLNYSTTSLGNLYYDLNDPDGPDGIWLTADDGLRPGAGSPVREEGNNGWVNATAKDIAGSPRIKGCSIDIGAYEYESEKILLYVDAQNGNDNNSGNAWNNAYRSLKKALDIANASTCVDTILVAKGVYYPTGERLASDPTIAERESSFRIARGGIKIYGGFQPGGAGGWAARELPDGAGAGSVLSGDIAINADSTFNSNHVMMIIALPASADSVIVEGFGVTAGNSNRMVNQQINGVWVSFLEGGGVYLDAVSAKTQLRDCFFYRNHSEGWGGAMVSRNGDPSVINCRFYNNTAITGGGALFTAGGAPKFINCNFFSNQARVRNEDGTPFGGSGGAIVASSSTAYLINCNVVNNYAETKGGAVFVLFNGTLDIRNSILWGNTSPNAKTIFIQTGTVTAATSIIEGGYAGTAILDADPMFVNGSAGNFQLQTCSPAINAGDNSGLPAFVTVDLNRSQRIQLGKIDMGAYESNAGITTASVVTVNATVVNIQSATGVTAYADGCNRLVAKLSGDNTFTSVSGQTTTRVWIETVQPDGYAKRHYEITPDQNAALATGRVTLFFTQQEFDDFNAANPVKVPVSASDAVGKARILIEKRPGVSSDGSGKPSTYAGIPLTIDPNDEDIVWNAVAARWEVSFAVAGFSGFFLKTQTEVLPLHLLSFSGKRQNMINLLHWETADEENVSHFAIERSSNGQDFSLLKNITAKNGRKQQYSINDTVAFTGSMYYRLKLVDIDGTSTYSHQIRLTSREEIKLIVYPNPAKDKLWMQLGNDQLAGTDMLLVDGAGRVLSTIRIRKQLQELSTTKLLPGVYFLRFSNGQVIKFFKD